ncbi:MAG: tRNA (adenosine(37)-N6)-threonylcarbamoyltransferase complex transferase subunit TsaD [Candidatus Paceibacterota bacterium]|jgi:N6-L-threonylcarbamoyladenine synthase
MSNMIILGIETSCDDTAISLIKTSASALKKKQPIFNDFEILSDYVSSQAKIHSPYGGVFPAIAKREHQKNITPLLIKSLKNAGLLKNNKKRIDAKKLLKVQKILEKNQDIFNDIKELFKKYSAPEINKIAVTTGPGLEPCLYTGINFARALGAYWNIPLSSVNHLEGHIIANWLSPIEKIEFPAIALVVSGGNTQIINIESLGKYKLIGETRDDASGECFDKTARILGLGYPGGPLIAKEAKKFKARKFNISLPRPMKYDKNYDFSFSGLKTAVLYDFKKRSEKERKSSDYIIEMCYEIEKAITDVLVFKTMKAAESFKTKNILLGGGVSANKELIKEFKKQCKFKKIGFNAPLLKFSGDNASMIALTALFSHNAKTLSWQKIKPNSNLKINE